MSKIITLPTIKNFEKIKDLCDGYIIGITNLSVNTSMIVDEIDYYINYAEKNGKMLYFNLNKNMKNIDLINLEKVLVELSTKKIAGVMFYDIAVVSINKRLNLNLNLIWCQEHFTTNYFTSNYWYDEGVNGMHISSEITLVEIKEIIANSKMNLFLTIFGYIPMFNSFRHLVKNYLKTFDIKSDLELHYMEEQGKLYPIIDNEYGTTVYSANILSALDEYLELKNENLSFIVDCFLLEDNKVIEILEMIKNQKVNNERIEELYSNIDKGFLYKETIYKVKR